MYQKNIGTKTKTTKATPKSSEEGDSKGHSLSLVEVVLFKEQAF